MNGTENQESLKGKMIYKNAKWRIGFSYFVMFLIISLGIITPFLLLGNDHKIIEEKRVPIIAAIIFLEIASLASCAIIFFIVHKIKLIISEEGITYCQWGFCISVRWNEINKIAEYYPWMPFCTGIMVEQGHFEGNCLNKYSAKLFHLDRFIPLSAFDLNWRSNDIGDILRCKAPHLFSEIEKKTN